VFRRQPEFFHSSPVFGERTFGPGDRLIITSTYSFSFLLLKRIGFWDTDVIPEDYRVFFKAFFAMRGDIGTNPIFLKTSMDSPLSPTYIGSLRNNIHKSGAGVMAQVTIRCLLDGI